MTSDPIDPFDFEDFCTADGCHEPAVGESLYGLAPGGEEIVELVCYAHLPDGA